MELKYVVLMIIKILISVPTGLMLQVFGANGAALMGGHYDNKNNTTNLTEPYYDYEMYDSQELSLNNSSQETLAERNNSEEIPNPSPLVSPGYNLPEKIFNKGKPFYLEKDPLTGKIDFSKSPPLKLDDDLYDYVDEEPSDNIYDKANIDRKDGSLGSHRPSDVNQLTPNFHDFLNLPIKYNSDKYVYPLISSSYANTKIQGNVNKYHNHKDYNQKTSTYKPNPSYYSSLKTNYFVPTTKRHEYKATTTSTTTTEKTTTNEPVDDVYSTSYQNNLMNSAIGHPSFNEEFEDDYYEPTKGQKSNEVYLTTENINNIYLTSKASTTKKTMSLFEQLFGDYDDTVPTTEKTKPPSLFANLPTNKSKNKYDGEIKTEKPSYTTPIHSYYPNSHAGPNIITNNKMGSPMYEYEDDYSSEPFDDNIAVENKNTQTVKPINKTNITEKQPTITRPSKIPETEKTKTEGTLYEMYNKENDTDYYEYDYQDKENQTSTTIPITSTITYPSIKVTSLPLGENHITSLNNRQPIIVATQNLKEILQSEKVPSKPLDFEKTLMHAPSTSNIHIAHDQATVSFVVGNHQNVDGGQYIPSAPEESPYESNPFRPFYGDGSHTQQPTYKLKPTSEVYKVPLPNFSGPAASSVTIHPLENSEASLSIGVPVNSLKQIPGQVVDENLEIKNEQIEFPKGSGPKIVFPDEKEAIVPDLVPPPPEEPLPLPPPPPNREVLKLNSKPMYHQLPSDLTPPKEKEVNIPLRFERPRPPWDPRPGHFYSGKPEYARPPRPPPNMVFKRIDNLPNILPQFRPNMKLTVAHHFDNRLVRQPLLERPSNRPIGFFEKLQPPPPPHPLHLHSIRKIPTLPPQSLDTPIAEDRIINEGPPNKQNLENQDHFNYYTPPKLILANRRNGDDDIEVETLQMLQAKHTDKKEILPMKEPVEPSLVVSKDPTEKPLYVVYPVNTPPIKMDVIDTNKKESVVIGTRAESPLPPSKINSDFNYEQNPILNPKDRNDSPILKPHPRPPTFPIKSDFPYPLERPDPSVIHPAVPEAPSNNGINMDDSSLKPADESLYLSNNQWNTVESRIVTRNKNHNSNQISATIKTYTEKPIAVAYTPTESHQKHEVIDKFSLPNYGGPVIPEIRPGTVTDEKADIGNPDGEYTVGAIMHTRPQSQNTNYETSHVAAFPTDLNKNHKSDEDSANTPTQLDFQAPFQASVSIDSMNQGWKVVKDKNRTTTDATQITTPSSVTTTEFDIENFHPKLIGGFKPIYDFPERNRQPEDTEIKEREE